MKRINKFLSLVKFSHTLFALPFAIIGFFLGSDIHSFDPKLLIFVILCMVFARNAAMGFNRLIDRTIDKINPRTAQREIPKGIISSNSAVLFVSLNSLLFIFTAYFINFLVFCLSPVALMVILGYSYSKRFTFLCHFILGLGLSLAPIGSFLSVTGYFSVLPIIFSLVVLCWVSGFDIIYALQDIEFDLSQKLYSIPVKIGITRSLILSSVLHLLSGFMVILAGYYGNFHLFYFIGAFIFLLLLLYQHLIVKPSDLSKINIAFFTTNGIASVIFAFFVVIDLIIYK